MTTKGPKGIETKAKIVSVALDLFYQKGLHNVSIPEIGQRVGVSHAAIYPYFKDKSDILCAGTEFAFHEIRNFIDSKIDPKGKAAARLERYIDVNFDWVTKFPSYANAILSMYYFGANDEKLHALHSKTDADTVARIEMMLSHGNHENAWSVKEPKATAWVIHDLIVGELIKVFHRPREKTKAERKSLIWGAVQALLRN